MTDRTPNPSPTQTTALDGLRDVSPYTCDQFGGADRGAPVLLLNTNAPPDRLLGFIRGQCADLMSLADFAARGEAHEDDLKSAMWGIWQGLNTVLAGIDALAGQLPPPK